MLKACLLASGCLVLLSMSVDADNRRHLSLEDALKPVLGLPIKDAKPAMKKPIKAVNYDDIFPTKPIPGMMAPIVFTVTEGSWDNRFLFDVKKANDENGQFYPVSIQFPTTMTDAMDGQKRLQYGQYECKVPGGYMFSFSAACQAAKDGESCKLSLMKNANLDLVTAVGGSSLSNQVFVYLQRGGVINLVSRSNDVKFSSVTFSGMKLNDSPIEAPKFYKVPITYSASVKDTTNPLEVDRATLAARKRSAKDRATLAARKRSAQDRATLAARKRSAQDRAAFAGTRK